MRKHSAVFILLFMALMPLCLMGKPIVIAIQNGRLYTITNGIIESGTILIQDGKIIDIGPDVRLPSASYVIDAAGKMVFPGFIDGFTNLGTADIESQNQDSDEATSPITPHLRIIDALNPENRFIKLTRNKGITSVLCAPGEGNLLSGQSAFINLTGRTVEDMLIKFPVAVHGSLGEIPKLRYGGKNQYPSTRMGSAALLRQTLTDAMAYQRKLGQEKPPPVDFKLVSLVPVVAGRLPLIIRANRRDDILTLLRIADEYKLKIILNHGAEAFRVADKLAARNIPVILAPVSSLQQREETSRAQLENAALLSRAGVKIVFQTGSFKNFAALLFQAETAIKYGLSQEEALKALTIYPAEVFGVADKLGALEKGKLANILIFNNNPFAIPSRPNLVIINGEIID